MKRLRGFRLKCCEKSYYLGQFKTFWHLFLRMWNTKQPRASWKNPNSWLVAFGAWLDTWTISLRSTLHCLGLCQLEGMASSLGAISFSSVSWWFKGYFEMKRNARRNTARDTANTAVLCLTDWYLMLFEIDEMSVKGQTFFAYFDGSAKVL